MMAGIAAYQGCPVADQISFRLHTFDLTRSGACPGHAAYCQAPAVVEVRVFDHNHPDFDEEYGNIHPISRAFDDIFGSDIGRVATCTTDATSGDCIAGEAAVGYYLVIVKYFENINGTDYTVYLGKFKWPVEFQDTDGDGLRDLATKDFQLIKFIRRNGDVYFVGGLQKVLSGSYLEIISPDYATWEEAVDSYVYPYIFTSDSDWDVDVCAEVPQGYNIQGVYDAEGELITTAECVQTLVANETKVVAFEVVDLESPPPQVTADFTIRHKGQVHAFELVTPGHRQGRDEPSGEQGALVVKQIAPVPVPMDARANSAVTESGPDARRWPSRRAILGLGLILGCLSVIGLSVVAVGWFVIGRARQRPR
jgi:hypothetical protein